MPINMGQRLSEEDAAMMEMAARANSLPPGRPTLSGVLPATTPVRENIDDGMKAHIDETLKHRNQVKMYIFLLLSTIQNMGEIHDKSKLLEPEARLFADNLSKLRGMTYGSPEYQKSLETLKPAIEHHYAFNAHHPEHFKEGVAGMTLVDLVEMFCDWIAATQRHADGDIMASIEKNEVRFNLDPQLVSIFKNTAKMLGRGKTAPAQNKA